MKVRVINTYRDKITKKVCKVGDVLDYPEERAVELIDKGNVISEPAETEDTPTEKVEIPEAKEKATVSHVPKKKRK
jgi:hypothetical protein